MAEAEGVIGAPGSNSDMTSLLSFVFLLSTLMKVNSLMRVTNMPNEANRRA